MSITARDVVEAASLGNLELLKKYKEQGLNLGEGDYDRRTPLHLAASEGKLEVVKWLIDNGVDVNCADRWNGTPLADALRHKHDEIAAYLKEKGGKIFINKTDLVGQLCQAASEGNTSKVYKFEVVNVNFKKLQKKGDVDQMRRLVLHGVDINSGDYDHRTPLHLAASEGKIKAVEFLINEGANVNAEDRWGGTPIQDAERHFHHDVVKLLQTAGARYERDVQTSGSSDFIGALHHALALVCEKQKWIYGDLLLVTDGKLHRTDLWYGANEHINLLAIYRKVRMQTGGIQGIASRAFENKKPEWVEDESVNNYAAFLNKEAAIRVGFKTSLAVPVILSGEVAAVLVFRDNVIRTKDQNLIDDAVDICSKATISTGSSLEKKFSRGIFREQMNTIYNIILQEGVFSSSVILREVDWFYNGLRLNSAYFENFPPNIIANHIHGFIAAKKLAQTTGTTEDIELRQEPSFNSAFYIIPDKAEKQIAIERYIESKYLNEGYVRGETNEDQNSKVFATSIRQYYSGGTAGPNSKVHLNLYFVDRNPWINPNPKPKETDLWEISHGMFIQTKQEVVRNRYEEIIKRAVNTLNPVVKLNQEKDEIGVMIAYRHGSTHSYYSSISTILAVNKVICVRKYLESFSNGILVISLYIRDKSLDEVTRLVDQAIFLYILPRTSLTPLFEDGKLTAQEVVYAYAGWKFAYHFLNRQPEEYNTLRNALKSDEDKLQKLIALKRKLRSEVANEPRILEVIFNYPQLIKEFYAEFAFFHEKRKFFENGKPNGQINKNLASRIQKEATSELDSIILTLFLTFNAHVLKTNFYKTSKSALNFRLNPKFLANYDYPAIPHGIFFIIGAEFRGFHIRFKDVARGGIRLIISRNVSAFQANSEGLFDENYNLAWTQQNKNKDIPEGGSKGTILLGVSHQGSARIAFEKYIDALLDLMVVSDEILDHVGVPEYIYCGPDEGTADLMDWSALHAKARGYKYWTAFTTGKSTHLGGIPHDMYGMTTKGVHEYVVQLLKKLNVDETSIRKFQTGGPDGDLGSNEIKISKDKTIAIVDGSGVLYDPQGIDRTELLTLANQRKMVKFFDKSKLSPKGFLVLIEDKDIKLPDGTMIESGLYFRNTFHLHSLSSAELFVPCGGRPAAVNINNVRELFDNYDSPERKPRFKYIVEGANLFFTQEARLILEEAGVILFKDASANKGGVTSSSLEVLAGLAFTEKEFIENMQVKNDGKDIPAFYSAYVTEVQERIAENARLEFNCIWNEMQANKSKSSILTDQLSDKINSLNDYIQESSMWKKESIRRKVLQEALPKALLNKLGLETILQRVPEGYIRAIFGAHLASRYIYQYGLNPNEFKFFEFASKYT